MESYQVIILAAGQGKRMKANINKQFITIGSEPLLAHTIAVFEQDDWCDSIYLVIQEMDREMIESVVAEKQFSKVKKCVTGGKERQDSVRLGLEAVDPSKITMIHDGARPFVTQDELHRLHKATQNTGAAFLAVPVTDTIKQFDGDRVKTLKRSELFAAQTPQAFRYDLIHRAHEWAYNQGIQATDDVQLLELMEQPIELVKGSYRNMKLTTPEDIQRAENMLQINRQSIQEEEL
ncbi:2-C-methyl-D-erythritol 4-phosphate cytidylyltransferase [Allobacillus sp. SKP2-8]|uniref:2-C-methyl-D-erythritol 4-phosphate cytidylyltransferase n=1 Tax=unclassified Allobacillus TaxID=2628859 RepID=UPI0011829642|nr:2-C-methyl-D-erythritol 4-phosphate cytidylyltransferase [Allobacillus sp. SKP2-8]TSJ63532.1 2-C-methyl-D-erythritol 4-phosphate cytidylyltransferase [Allobacillus sp. SKP2-8]